MYTYTYVYIYIYIYIYILEIYIFSRYLFNIYCRYVIDEDIVESFYK